MHVHVAHSHENDAIFDLIFHKHTTTEIGWQFAYKQHFVKVSNNIKHYLSLVKFMAYHNSLFYHFNFICPIKLDREISCCQN